jgi:hypothetical protein
MRKRPNDAIEEAIAPIWRLGRRWSCIRARKEAFDDGGAMNCQPWVIFMAVLGWIGFVGQTIIGTYWWFRAMDAEDSLNHLKAFGEPPKLDEQDVYDVLSGKTLSRAEWKSENSKC